MKRKKTIKITVFITIIAAGLVISRLFINQTDKFPEIRLNHKDSIIYFTENYPQKASWVDDKYLILQTSESLNVFNIESRESKIIYTTKENTTILDFYITKDEITIKETNSENLLLTKIEMPKIEGQSASQTMIPKEGTQRKFELGDNFIVTNGTTVISQLLMKTKQSDPGSKLTINTQNNAIQNEYLIEDSVIPIFANPNSIVLEPAIPTLEKKVQKFDPVTEDISEFYIPFKIGHGFSIELTGISKSNEPIFKIQQGEKAAIIAGQKIIYKIPSNLVCTTAFIETEISEISVFCIYQNEDSILIVSIKDGERELIAEINESYNRLSRIWLSNDKKSIAAIDDTGELWIITRAKD